MAHANSSRAKPEGCRGAQPRWVDAEPKRGHEGDFEISEMSGFRELCASRDLPQSDKRFFSLSCTAFPRWHGPTNVGSLRYGAMPSVPVVRGVVRWRDGRAPCRTAGMGSFRGCYGWCEGPRPGADGRVISTQRLKGGSLWWQAALLCKDCALLTQAAKSSSNGASWVDAEPKRGHEGDFEVSEMSGFRELCASRDLPQSDKFSLSRNRMGFLDGMAQRRR